MSDVDYHRHNCKVAVRLADAFRTPRLSTFFAGLVLDRSAHVGSVRGDRFVVWDSDAFRAFATESPDINIVDSIAWGGPVEQYLEFADESLRIVW